MKKANKIVMATVAILLSLVLFTTSIVSGIFAMYAVRTYGSASFTFKKFGVIVELSFSEDFLKIYGDVIEDNTVVNGDSVTITIPTLKMAPGDSFRDAIQFNISGTAKTNCSVTVDMTYIYVQSDYQIPDGSTKYKTDSTYFPYNLYCSLGSNEILLYDGEPNSDYRVENDVINLLDKHLVCSMYGTTRFVTHKLSGNTDHPDYYLYKKFTANTPINFTDGKNTSSTTDDVVFNDFKFGVEWPFVETNNAEKMDTLYSWLAINKNPRFEMSYTVVVEAVA